MVGGKKPPTSMAFDDRDFEALFVVVAPVPSEYRPRGGVFLFGAQRVHRMECRWNGECTPNCYFDWDI